MEAARIGLDVTRSLFELHGVDTRGSVVLRSRIARARLQETFARLPRCIVGLESVGTAFRWGHELASLGHDVRLMPPHAVAPYRERLGAEASTAQVICEALGSAGTRFTQITVPRRSLWGLYSSSRILRQGLVLFARRERGASDREIGG